jgi:hypothetical protein
VDLSYIRQVEAGFQYPRTMMYGFFAKRTDPPSSSLLFWLPASSFLPSPATFPDPLRSPIAHSRDFHHASGLLNNALLSAHFRVADQPPGVSVSLQVENKQFIGNGHLIGSSLR